VEPLHRPPGSSEIPPVESECRDLRLSILVPVRHPDNIGSMRWMPRATAPAARTRRAWVFHDCRTRNLINYELQAQVATVFGTERRRGRYRGLWIACVQHPDVDAKPALAITPIRFDATSKGSSITSTYSHLSKRSRSCQRGVHAPREASTPSVASNTNF